MMKCVSVCLSRKIITSHFRAEHWRREVSSPLGLAGFGLVTMMIILFGQNRLWSATDRTHQWHVRSGTQPRHILLRRFDAQTRVEKIFPTEKF